MVNRIELTDVALYADGHKLNIQTLDPDLEAALDGVVAQLSTIYAVSGWNSPANTPPIVRQLLGMYYVAWWYLRTYSNDASQNGYGLWLMERADGMLTSLLTKQLVLIGVPEAPGNEEQLAHNTASFYPNDSPAKFGMDHVW